MARYVHVVSESREWRMRRTVRTTAKGYQTLVERCPDPKQDDFELPAITQTKRMFTSHPHIKAA